MYSYIIEYMKYNSRQKFELLGKNIKELREKYTLTLKELSIKSGIRKQYLQKIENGTAYGFAISHLEKLMIVFDGNLKDILKGL